MQQFIQLAIFLSVNFLHLKTTKRCNDDNDINVDSIVITALSNALAVDKANFFQQPRNDMERELSSEFKLRKYGANLCNVYSTNKQTEYTQSDSFLSFPFRSFIFLSSFSPYKQKSNHKKLTKRVKQQTIDKDHSSR